MTLPSLRPLTLALVLAAAAAVACSKDNPNYCDGVDCTATDGPLDSPPVSCDGNGPDTTCPADNPVCVSGECVGGCTVDTDCDGRAASESTCHVGSGDCVTCDEDDRQAEPGSAEEECPGTNNAVCDADTHTCRACEAHEECFSGVCDAGVCASESAVVYLDLSGTDGGACGTRAAPCLTLNGAVDRVQADNVLHKYIVMTPSGTPYQARGNMDRADFDDVDVYVVGTGATVNRNGAGEVIDVHGGSDVTIEGLEVSNATGTTTGTGIIVNASTLTLLNAKIRNNAYRGVNAVATSNLRISRSVISNNDGGGVSLESGTFVIVNNVIAGNGDELLSSFGGVSVNGSGTTNLLEFNTIVSNSATAGTADGIICNNVSFVARNNIVTGDGANPRYSGNCSHSHTLWTPTGAAPGLTNMEIADQSNYQFTADFHIGATSVAAGKAQSTNLTGELLFDMDGDARTGGGTTVDVGADEIP